LNLEERVRQDMNKSTSEIKTPLDVVVDGLIKKRKDIERETEKLLERVTEYVNEKIKLLRENGYVIEENSCEKEGLLHVVCRMKIVIDKDTYIAANNYEDGGYFDGYDAKVFVRTDSSNGYYMYVTLLVKKYVELFERESDDDEEDEYEEDEE